MQSPRSEVRQAAQASLAQSPHAAIRKISCEFGDGVLVLRGRVPSYYHKQLAQETIAHVEGVARIINEIDVTQ